MKNTLKLSEFYTSAYTSAIDADPRGRGIIEKELLNNKKEYEKTDENKKKYFDKDRLVNPYDDSRVLFGNLDTEIKTIACGIDLQGAELLLIDRLREKGRGVDLAVTHHPNGHAYAGFYKVMGMQVDIHASYGMFVNQAEALNKKRMSTVERSVSSANHMRDVDIARELNIAYVAMHTFADNHVEKYLTKLVEEKKPYLLSDILDMLFEIEEYKMSAMNNNPPKLFSGSEKNRAGKVMVDMTGGTTFDVKCIERLANAGIGTIVVMHLPDTHREEAEKHNMNVVVASHIASDSLGLNLLFDDIKLRTKSSFDIIPLSGFIRVER